MDFHMETLILLILLKINGVWSAEWQVTLKSQCVLRGTSVVIQCEYKYPKGYEVSEVVWHKFNPISGEWRQLSSLSDHFRYVGNYWGDCSLKINNVQQTDEGQYFFAFDTHGKWTSSTSAYLSVKDLTVVQPSMVTVGDNVSLTCKVGCPTPVLTVWFRDGRPVRKDPVFQARKEDAGRYHCAVWGQETARSASVSLNVQYPPEKVMLAVSPSGGVIKGSSVTFTCSSDANPPVSNSGYSLFKGRSLVGFGQNHTISGIQPASSGLYYCQAWNSVSQRGLRFFKSTEVLLDVQYHPMNISISQNPQLVVRGASVNLTCTSDANPAADKYTWYKRTDSTGSMLQVGSGQVLSVPPADALASGLYLCRAANHVGESNSTEVLLAVTEEGQGSLMLTAVAGTGVALVVALMLALLLFWRKQRNYAQKNETVCDNTFNGKHSHPVDPSSSVYANIYTLPTSPPPVTDITPYSKQIFLCQNDAPTPCSDEVMYSTVTVKPRNPGCLHDNGAPQDSWTKSETSTDSVIYAAVAKSS